MKRQERLHIVAAHLHLIYSDGPLTKPEAFAGHMRLLLESERSALPTVSQMCAGIKPNHDVEYIVVCPVCGQMLDCRDGPQLEHHSTEDHEPKLKRRARAAIH